MRWLVLLTVSSLALAACGGSEFTSSGAEGGTSGVGASGGRAGTGGSGVGGNLDGGSSGFGGSEVGGGGSGGNTTGGSGGMTVTDCPFPAGLRVPSEPTYHSTLDTLQDVLSPAIGVGKSSNVSTDPSNDFFQSECDFGIQINGKNEFFTIPEAGDGAVNIDYRQGTLMFYFTPYFDSSDNSTHMLFETDNQEGGGFVLEKAATNELRFIAKASGGAGLTFQQQVRPQDYSFVHNQRVHIALSWNLVVTAGGLTSVKIFLNGNALPLQGALNGLNMRDGNEERSLRFGNTTDGANFADGLFDDIWIFKQMVPDP
ncbi:MAG: LamG-like jellyroll fold domain-containing protein [Polyangiaceae bacterium]